MPVSVPRRWVPKTVQPNPTSTYGPAIWADDLNNSIIGGPNSTQSAYRFRASTSSTITGLTIYIIGPSAGAGYGAGTGGTIRTTLQSDSSGLPSGSVLATASDFTGSSSTATQAVTFPTPYSVTAGTVYHLVFSNVHATPSANYCSVDNLFTFSDESPWQPKWPANQDFAEVTKIGSNAWTDERGAGQGTNTPIVDITYGSGAHQGQGYLETWGRGGSDGYITCDGTKRFRETFTPSSTVTATGVYFRLARTSGTGALSVRLETTAGVEVETVTIAAANIATATRGGTTAHGDGQRSYFLPFTANRTLTSGVGYNLEFSCAAGTEYWTTAIRHHSSYDTSLYFTDGNAQVYDGASWTNTLSLAGTASALSDLQFHFTTV